jgi:heat shock protein HslJ
MTMRALAAALLGLALSACAAQTPTTGPNVPASYLAGTSWRRVDDTNANPHGATIAFSADRASGYTGCNNWFASVTHDGEALRFGNVGTTRRACDGAGVQIDTERNFLAVIEATRYAHYDQDALVLLDENQQVIAEFNVE